MVYVNVRTRKLACVVVTLHIRLHKQNAVMLRYSSEQNNFYSFQIVKWKFSYLSTRWHIGSYSKKKKMVYKNAQEPKVTNKRYIFRFAIHQ